MDWSLVDCSLRMDPILWGSVFNCAGPINDRIIPFSLQSTQDTFPDVHFGFLVPTLWCSVCFLCRIIPPFLASHGPDASGISGTFVASPPVISVVSRDLTPEPNLVCFVTLSPRLSLGSLPSFPCYGRCIREATLSARFVFVPTIDYHIFRFMCCPPHPSPWRLFPSCGPSLLPNGFWPPSLCICINPLHLRNRL